MNNYIRLYHTLKYLKSIQFYYRFYYLFKTKFRKITRRQYPFLKESVSSTLALDTSINSRQSYKKNKFSFLNLEKTFDATIDWNYPKYGKLWTYNLTYFDFLHQNGISKDDGLKLIHDFIISSNSLKDALEPFPISLRGINWIKFIVKNNIQNQTIDDSLYAQYEILRNNLEYHLLGNHLLENGFSLLFGAYYFKDEVLYTTAKRILTAELQEQILSDGAHFERSPMYHQIMLYRILDCINLMQNNLWKAQELLPLFQSKAAIMLGWLKTITYTDGTIPLLNDSTNGIAPTTTELTNYATALGIQAQNILLKESGYHKVVKEMYECIVDVGNIGPDYIPGHAHSDTFNFELHINGKPIIVDTGLSTYETNLRRNMERSTESHNTVMIDSKEQSEVWGGFRVGRRAKIIHLREKIDVIEATHDGYKSIGAMHTRKFSFQDHQITIEDSIESSKIHRCTAFLHSHPDVNAVINDNTIILDNTVIKCIHYDTITTDVYQYAPEFNKLIPATVIKITFTKNLTMEINL